MDKETRDRYIKLVDKHFRENTLYRNEYYGSGIERVSKEYIDIFIAENILIIDWLDKYNYIIQFLYDTAEEECRQTIGSDGEPLLEWLWEYDNGLYTESGSMPFICSKKKWDETWAGEETEKLFTNLGLNYDSSIHDARCLIEAVYTMQLL